MRKARNIAFFVLVAVLAVAQHKLRAEGCSAWLPGCDCTYGMAGDPNDPPAPVTVTCNYGYSCAENFPLGGGFCSNLYEACRDYCDPFAPSTYCEADWNCYGTCSCG